MNKKLSLLFLAFIPIVMMAYCKVDGIYYDLDTTNKTATVVQNAMDTYLGSVDIPSTFVHNSTLYTVTSIGKKAFNNCEFLYSVTIPESVTSIGDEAFQFCRRLDYPVIPESVTSIGSYAFFGCYIASVTIPSNVTSIGEGAFLCYSLSTVIVENPTPVSITSGTFSNLSNATLYVPSGSKAAYEAAEEWREFGNIIEMGTNGPAITFTDNMVKSICVANWDTDHDDELSEEEAAAVTNLGSVFQNSQISSFNELRYFTGLGSIGNSAFSNSTVSSITLPENITSIGDYAFHKCSALKAIHLPAKVMTLGKSALSRCTAMTAITVAEGNDAFCSVDGVLFTKDKTTLIQFPIAKSSAYIVPEGTTIIGTDAFYQSKLVAVNLPSSLKELAYDAFGYCQELTKMEIPEGVTTIGDYILDHCSALTTLHIPESVTSIGQRICNDCNAITQVYCDIENPFEINSNCFTTTTYTNAKLHVPAGKYNSYASMSGWKEFKQIIEDSQNIIFADSKVKALCVANWDTDGDGELSESEASSVSFLGAVFQGSQIDSFHELLYFTGLSAIGSGTFSNSLVKAITLPENITSLEEYAFYRCQSLSTINIPEKVQKIGTSALSYCTSLSAITVDEGNTAFCSIDGVLFTKDKTTLIQFPISKTTAYAVPEGTKTIGRDAFFKSKLESITLPSSLRELGYDAFGASKDLGRLIIPEGVTTIGDYILDQCYAIKVLHIPSSVTSIGQKICNSNAITDVYCDIQTPFEINSNCFTTTAYTNATLHVPASKRNEYAGTMGWREFRSIISDEVTYTLSIQSSAGGTITYNGTSITNEIQSFFVLEGYPITLSISPEAGYELKFLTINGANVTPFVTDGQYTITNITTNTTVVAQFSKKVYTLSINSSGNGQVSYNANIIEESTQSFNVEHGSTAIFTLTPQGGHMLSALSVNGSNAISQLVDGKLTINNISENTSVVAVFEPIPVTSYTLSIQSSDGGTIVYNGVNVTNDTQSFSINEGVSVSLSVVPNIGYELSRLILNGTDVTAGVSDGKYIIESLSENVNVSAIFTKRSFNLSIESYGNGTVTFNSVPITNTTGNFFVLYGSSATMTLTPDMGYQVSSVKLNGENVTANVSDGSFTIPNITGNNTVRVDFEVIPVNTYSLTLVASIGGGITFNGATVSGSSQSFTVNEGASATLTISADTGFELNKLTLNGNDVTSWVINNKIRIFDISQNTTIEAIFIKKTYLLTIESTGGGQVTYGSNVIDNETNSFSVEYNTSATLVLIPNEGYQLANLIVNGNNVTAAVTNSIYTIANISSSQQVNVSFEKIPAKTFTLSINVGSGGVVSYNGVELSNTTRDFIVTEGESTELDIVPDMGYRIKSVSINNKDMMSSIVDNSLSVRDIRSDTSVKVEFESIPISKVTILITVSSGGKVECNGMSISNESRSIAIDEGSSIELTVLANVQYKLGKLTVDDTDMTSSVVDNKVVINNITHNLNINAIFDMILEDFTVNNVRYGIISSESRELEVQVDDYRGHITIPNTIQYNGLSWMVTRIANHAFSGNPKLITVSIPSSVELCGKDVFANCSSLSAIIWQPMSPLSKDQAGNIENRNLLFYTSSEEYAPSGVSNVVVNNIAKQIRLLENNEFYCPQPFIAENISYTHHYIMETGIGESKGWETIVLPFDVKRITHSSKGEIVPFAAYTGGNNVHPFWLYGYDSVLGFVEATGIEANRPYIISMPNNPRYADEYILAGTVEFSADNIIVKSSADMLSVTHGDNRFCPTFQTTTKDVKALNVQNDFVNYSGGNKPGSTFIYGLREVRPFEAYMTSESGAFVSVAIFDDLTTTIGEIPEKDDYLCNRVTVYTTAGQVVRVVSNCTIEEALRSLAPGVYIINGRKIVVR